MGKTYGVGIMGAGNISAAYLRLAPLFRNLEVRGVADVGRRGRLRAAAAAAERRHAHNRPGGRGVKRVTRCHGREQGVCRGLLGLGIQLLLALLLLLMLAVLLLAAVPLAPALFGYGCSQRARRCRRCR